MIAAMVRPSTEQLRRDIAAWNSAAREAIAACTVCLYGAYSGVPIARGTGVLVRVGEVPFLLSAAHVLDAVVQVDSEGNRDAFFLSDATPGAGAGTFVPLGDAQVVVSVAPREGRERDQVDCGFVRLSPETALTLVNKKFLELSRISTTMPSTAWYHLYGFPAEGAHGDIETNCARATPLRYGAILKTELGADGVEGINVDFKAQVDGNIDAETGQAVELPFPDGVSGCGVWRLWDGRPAGRKAWSLDEQVRLVAIEHWWRPRDEYFRATRIDVVLRMIASNYPELKGIIQRFLPA